LPTFPFSHLNEDWFVEIEDITTLFFPYVVNGQTGDKRLGEIRQYPLIKHLLESPRCKGILTHVGSTKRAVEGVFRSEMITGKVTHIPVAYVPREQVSEDDLDAKRSASEARFFFNNSWHQSPINFYLRGGISILEAFEEVLRTEAPVQLVLRSRLPRDLESRFHNVLIDPRVSVMDRFMPNEKYLEILRQSHYFLLPSARLHIVSLLESMYYGAVPIVSDGWGILEHVEDGKTGHVLSGVYGKVSWEDEETSELREDYTLMYRAPGLVSQSLKDKIEQLVSEPGRRREVALAAHRYVKTNHSIEKFNRSFKDFLDRGTAQA
jgi:glycosyltransferase involved in cell wall biosynthesis